MSEDALPTARKRPDYVYWIRIPGDRPSDPPEDRVGRTRNPWVRIQQILAGHPGAVMKAVADVEKVVTGGQAWLAGKWKNAPDPVLIRAAELAYGAPRRSHSAVVPESVPIVPNCPANHQLVQLAQPESLTTSGDFAIVCANVSANYQPPVTPSKNNDLTDGGTCHKSPGDLHTEVEVKRSSSSSSSARTREPKIDKIAEVIPKTLAQLGVVPEKRTAWQVGDLSGRPEYNAARDQVAFAWGKDPANAAMYRAIVAAANNANALLLDTALGQRARNRGVIDACAVAAKFPTFEVWLAEEEKRIAAEEARTGQPAGMSVRGSTGNAG